MISSFLKHFSLFNFFTLFLKFLVGSTQLCETDYKNMRRKINGDDMLSMQNWAEKLRPHISILYVLVYVRNFQIFFQTKTDREMMVDNNNMEIMKQQILLSPTVLVLPPLCIHTSIHSYIWYQLQCYTYHSLDNFLNMA